MYGTGAGSTTVAEVCRTTPPQAVRAYARLLAIAGVLACVVPVASKSPATGRIVGWVRLQGMPSTPVPPKRYELRQEGEVFLPHVLPVGHGASIDFTTWHERVGEAKISVNVPAGGETAVEFVLPAVES
jgi:hypothetical protein